MESDSPLAKPGLVHHSPFISLRNSEFRVFWIAQSVSWIGTWMQNITVPWVAFSLTNSPLMLGITGVFQYLPMLVFSLVAGAIIERYPRRLIIIGSQIALMAVSLVFFILIATGVIQFWHVLLLALLSGFANTFDIPTRHAFVTDLVGKQDLLNAISLNNATFNLARIIGPAVGGILMHATGAGICFLINAVSFMGVIIVLAFIKKKKTDENRPKTGPGIFADIKEGFRHIRAGDTLFMTVMLIGIVGIFAVNFGVLVPVFSRDVLGQEESGFGFLMAAMGAGSLVGALALAAQSRRGPRRIFLVVSPILIAVSLVMTGLMSDYILTAVCLALTGVFVVAFSANANSIAQLEAGERFRGRVMSVYTLLFAGSTPVGNLFCGIMMHFFGARAGFIFSGLAIIACLAVFFLAGKKTLARAFTIRS